MVLGFVLVLTLVEVTGTDCESTGLQFENFGSFRLRRRGFAAFAGGALLWVITMRGAQVRLMEIITEGRPASPATGREPKDDRNNQQDEIDQ